jgi:serine/threonine protein kinase
MAILSEGAEFISETGKTYLAVSSLGQSNVWTAVQKDDLSNVVVLKAPSDDDTPGRWPRFQHEMIMHELFKNSKNIRRQLDRIPPTPSGSPPMLVLELTETTLWGARTKRPFSRGEIVTAMRGILLSLQEIHDHGLVYGDLKMENVMVSGFDAHHAGDGSKLVIKLGDLGTVMQPAHGIMQPFVYRAPEVYFREEITPAADIWAVGLVYSHLLEAQSNFSKAGLYDNLTDNSSRMDERVKAVKNEISQDYDLQNNNYYKHCPLPERDLDHEKGSHWALMRKRGLQERDVDFLKRIMIANPRERPTARAILNSHWFQGGGLDGIADDLQQVDGAGNPPSLSSRRASIASFNSTSDSLAVKPPAVDCNFRHRVSESPPSAPAVKRIRSLQSPARSGLRELRTIEQADYSALLPSAESFTSALPQEAVGDLELENWRVQVKNTEDACHASLQPQILGPSASRGGTYLNYR